ncbi:MAG: GH3 auxin-responsive promoter family protein [Pirellulales bacterium]
MLGRYLYLCGKQYPVHRFLAGTRHAHRTQRAILLEKIRRNAESDFGRQHRFDEIRGVEDFRRRIPVTTYEYFRPYVERVKQGEISAMFGPGTQVMMFSMTSGTTAESKYIPITNHFFREYRKSWNIWGSRVFWHHPDLVVKHTLQFSSDWQQFHTSGGIPCGNVSGLAAETRPLISRPAFILPAALNKVGGTANKQYAALRLALPSRRVGMIVTANPLTLLNLARCADRHRESLIRDLFDGTLSEQMDVPNGVRKTLRRRLARRHPRRARQLEKLVEATGHLFPRDFWPKMSVLAVWMGGSVGGYLPKVREYYGDAVFRDHGLSASEGRMTTPMDDRTTAGVLDYVTHFFEFIPEGEHDRPDPTVLEAHELEEGKDYYILLTTSSGLYRYDIHDVVRCVGYRGECPLLEFISKGSHFSSLAGEKLSEFQVVTGVQAALADTGLSAEHFTLAPIPGDPPTYVLLLEEQLDSDTEQRLSRRVDMRLSEVNCEYEDRLQSNRLRGVSIQQVPPGSWDSLRRESLSRPGASAEQYKHPFLTSKTGLVSHRPTTTQGRLLPDDGTTGGGDRCQ